MNRCNQFDATKIPVTPTGETQEQRKQMELNSASLEFINLVADLLVKKWNDEQSQIVKKPIPSDRIKSHFSS